MRECCVWFEFKDGANPYAPTTYRGLWWMLTHYETEQTGAREFLAGDIRRPAKGYQASKEQARQIAIDWQSANDGTFPTSWQALAEWSGFFEWLGRRYGLLREFRENGII